MSQPEVDVKQNQGLSPGWYLVDLRLDGAAAVQLGSVGAENLQRRHSLFDVNKAVEVKVASRSR